jgi:D-threo-aldose 1-dehydrogenase
MDWPRLGLGCASLGAPDLPDAAAHAVIEAALARGIRLFDVAPLYGGGLAEQRLGHVLRGVPRDSYVLCTKTGVTRPFGQPPIPPGGTRRREADVWDYTPAATRASVLRSLERLGVARLDVVHLHDVEAHEHACLEAHEALARLREAGVVGGIGIGSNHVAPVERLLARAPFDAFLLAGRYTLLDHSGASLLESAHRKGVRTIAGGVFNSGVLAAWPQPAPTFGYEAAGADVLRRTAAIAAVCARHGVSLAAAALQYVLANPHVSTVLLGPRSVAELDASLAAAQAPLPATLWADLEREAGVPRPAQADAPSAVAANEAS